MREGSTMYWKAKRLRLLNEYMSTGEIHIYRGRRGAQRAVPGRHN
jgi:hypothetical protein